jgi:RNA polymerase sigma-70 factor (sigma-E family)
VSWTDELGELARMRGPALVGYASLLTGDRDAAQDLVQDALVRCYSRRAASGDVEWAEAYVRRAILHCYLDRSRRESLWRGVRHLVAPEPAQPGPERGVTDAADLRSALLTLAPRERACVVLRFYEDLTVADVADRLGLSTGAVKRYLSDAVRRLESRVGPFDDAHTEDLTTTITGARR